MLLLRLLIGERLMLLSSETGLELQFAVLYLSPPFGLLKSLRKFPSYLLLQNQQDSPAKNLSFYKKLEKLKT